MRAVKSWMIGSGIVIALAGTISFPSNPGINPERDTSLFSNLADYGMFVDYGLNLVGLGLLLIVIAVMIRSRQNQKQ